MTASTEALPLIELGAPILGEPEKRALGEVIDSGWLAMGERVRRFEQAFAAVQQTPDAVAVNSATAALHLMLAAFDIGPGDEVLVPSMTFVATAATVVHQGATPVFVDLEAPDRPHMSLDDAAAKITPRTKAIVVMHYGGYLMDLPSWRALADSHGILLLEDAAHAVGLSGIIGAGDTGVGTLSDAAAFSFFANKNMTTAEGGMVVARDPDKLARLRLLRAHGMTASTLDRDRGRAVGYDVVEFGHNFRLDELRAAVGLVQIERLPEWNDTRRAITAHYRSVLAAELPSVTVPFDPAHTSTAHILPVLLPRGADRTALMAALRAGRVQSSMHYPPVHRFTRYTQAYGEITLPNTDAFADVELTLPLHPRLTGADVERVVTTLRSALESD